MQVLTNDCFPRYIKHIISLRKTCRSALTYFSSELSLFLFKKLLSSLPRGNRKDVRKNNQEAHVVTHIICKATASDSFTIEEAEAATASPPPPKW